MAVGDSDPGPEGASAAPPDLGGVWTLPGRLTLQKNGSCSATWCEKTALSLEGSVGRRGQRHSQHQALLRAFASWRRARFDLSAVTPFPFSGQQFTLSLPSDRNLFVLPELLATASRHLQLGLASEEVTPSLRQAVCCRNCPPGSQPHSGRGVQRHSRCFPEKVTLLKG